VFGSMLDVVNNNTPYMAAEDIRAIAIFLKSLPATAQQSKFSYDDAATQTLQSGKPEQPGAAIYTGACSACHGVDGKGPPPFMPPLAGNPVVLDDRPVIAHQSGLEWSPANCCEGHP
jgi:mono/diheme cytochrome c family protein